MKLLSFFLIAILTIGAFSQGILTNTQVGRVGVGHHGMQETNTRTMMSNPALHPRFRRWGPYGMGYGGMGYGGMGYGRMGYGMGGYGMRGYGMRRYGMGFPMWG